MPEGKEDRNLARAQTLVSLPVPAIDSQGGPQQADGGAGQKRQQTGSRASYGSGAANLAATFSKTLGMTSGTVLTPFVKTATTKSRPFGSSTRAAR